MSTIDKESDKKFLELLKFNYQNLHKAVWEAHRISWIMTGIFVPIIFTSLGYFIKEFKNLDVIHTAIGTGVLIAVVWFWFSIVSILRRYNDVRRKQLIEIEDTFNALFADRVIEKRAEFKQYKLRYKEYCIEIKEKCKQTDKEKWITQLSNRIQTYFKCLGFHYVTSLFSIFLTVILIVVVLIKIGQYLRLW